MSRTGSVRAAIVDVRLPFLVQGTLLLGLFKNNTDSINDSEKKNSVQKGSRATMCSTIHKPSSHRGYTQQSSELGSCHIRNLAEGKRVDVFSVAYHLVSCLGASK